MTEGGSEFEYKYPGTSIPANGFATHHESKSRALPAHSIITSSKLHPLAQTHIDTAILRSVHDYQFPYITCSKAAPHLRIRRGPPSSHLKKAGRKRTAPEQPRDRSSHSRMKWTSIRNIDPELLANPYPAAAPATTRRSTRSSTAPAREAAQRRPDLDIVLAKERQIGRASCRERVF